MTTTIGLVRDFVAAVVGVLILFDVQISEAQGTGVVLVVATGLALGTHAYRQVRGAKR